MSIPGAGWAATLAAQAAPGGFDSFWFPSESSSTAGRVDWLFYFILAITGFFFLLNTSLMTYFVIRYRRRAGETARPAPSHSLPLELTWTLVPMALAAGIFYFGLKLYVDLRTTPYNAYPINVTAQKWKWSFTYPNGYTDEELHVPVATDVLLTMISEDVIHSLFIPDFRLKQDVLPGRYVPAWFRATRVGEFPLLCAEYCGTEHSAMNTLVVVHAPGEFEKWLEEAAQRTNTLSPVAFGERLYRTRACVSCHTTDGSASYGPTWKGLYGTMAVIREEGRESQRRVDENYVREKLLDPQKWTVVGPYSAIMPTYQGRLNDREIAALIAYLQSLGGSPKEPGNVERRP
jgi:cytochrome c oxidase subunit 2